MGNGHGTIITGSEGQGCMSSNQSGLGTVKVKS
jgi:hypothetical protein